jgi:MFS family permease
VSKNRFKNEYHPIVWTLLAGTIFARGSSFMAMPFLALYLSKSGDISPLLIGLTIGLGPLTGTVGGFIGGHLSDRFGRQKVMLSSLFTWSFVFLGFALADHVLTFMLLNALNGLCRSFFEPTSQALMADVTKKEKRLRVFSMRYTAINIGAAVGPLLGAYIGVSSANKTFVITALFYVLYGLSLFIMMKKVPLKQHSSEKKASLKKAFNIIRLDVALRYFIIGGILVNIGYSQVESSLPQHLQLSLSDGVALYSILLSANAIFVVVFQIPLSRLIEKWKILHTMILGSSFFVLGFVGFALSTEWVGFITSMVILTIGEIFIFPSTSVFIDQIAPEELRGTYFGAAQFRSIGHFTGPIIGGFLLESYNGHVMFWCISAIVAGSVYFFLIGNSKNAERIKELV